MIMHIAKLKAQSSPYTLIERDHAAVRLGFILPASQWRLHMILMRWYPHSRERDLRAYAIMPNGTAYNVSIDVGTLLGCYWSNDGFMLKWFHADVRTWIQDQLRSSLPKVEVHWL